MTQTSVKTRREFDEAFKRKAVKNWLHSGKSAAVIAKESGYSEITNAPLLPVAHSAATPFVWGMGDLGSSRIIAILPCKGWFSARVAPGVPAFHVSSE